MEIKFSLNREDMIKFYCSNITKTKQFNKGRIWTFSYIICLIGFVVLVTERNDMRIFIIILGAITVIFFKQISRIIIKQLLSKVYKKNEYSYMFDEKIIFINDEHISIKNKLTQKIISFDSISSLNLIEGYMFIVLSNKEYSLIPLSAFSSNEEKEQFIKLIESKSNLNVRNSYPDNLKYI